MILNKKNTGGNKLYMAGWVFSGLTSQTTRLLYCIFDMIFFRNPSDHIQLTVSINNNRTLTSTEMSEIKSNIKTTKAQAKRLFDEGYELAFQTKKKIKPWGKIFDL